MTAAIEAVVKTEKDQADSSKKVQVCLLGASLTTNNMGVGALAASLVKCAHHVWPGCGVNLLDFEKKAEQFEVPVEGCMATVATIPMRFSIKLIQHNNIVVLLLLAATARLLPAPFKKVLIASNKTLSNINNQDVYAAISGGDSFSDIYGFMRYMYVALPQLLVLLLGKSLLQMPQTYGPYASKWSRIFSAYILNKSEKIFARDLNSVAVVADLTGKSGKKAEFHYDVAFSLEPIEPKAADARAFIAKLKKFPAIIGLNVSGLLYTGGYTKNNMFGLKGDYRKLIDGFIDYFVNECCLPVLLVPHVYGGKENVESDTHACDKIYRTKKEQCKNLLFYYAPILNQNEVKYLIGQCSFFAGSRMHACIAALSQCIPAVGLAYSKKFSGVLESVCSFDLVADLRVCDNDSVLSVVQSCYIRRMEIELDLEKEMPNIRETVTRLFAKRD
jgi:colanic acid/amylovoran biosynthesis protein